MECLEWGNYGGKFISWVQNKTRLHHRDTRGCIRGISSSSFSLISSVSLLFVGARIQVQEPEVLNSLRGGCWSKWKQMDLEMLSEWIYDCWIIAERHMWEEQRPGWYEPCGVGVGWAGDGGAGTGSEGRSSIQTQAVVHHSYDDVLNTPASASVPIQAPVPVGAPATNQRQSITTCTRSVLFTCTPLYLYLSMSTDNNSHL